MNLDEYQEAAKRPAKQFIEWKEALCDFGMGVSGEAGEIANYLKKVVFHEHPLDPGKLEEEIGDVLWYIAMLCNYTGLSLSAIPQKNIEKLQKRYPEGFSPERSLQRE